MDSLITDAAHEPYEPPTIEDVPLRADEQVLGGCKTTSGPSPGREGSAFGCGGGCKNPGTS